MASVSEMTPERAAIRHRLMETRAMFDTVDQMTEATDVDRVLLYKYMRGDNIPNALILRKICAGANVSADWLLGLSDKRERG